MTAPQTTAAPAVVEAAVRAATAAAAALPSAQPLTAGRPTTDLTGLEMPGLDAQAVCVRFSGSVTGEVAVVVSGELVAALRTSPIGELDLSAAVEPALTAAAQSYGPVVLDAGRTVDALLAVESLARSGGAVAVPLVPAGGGAPGAVVLLDVTAPTRAAAAGPVPAERLELLRDVQMELTVELGRTRMSVRELLAMTPGSVVELDRAAGSPVDLLVNGRLIARGEVVVVDEDFGVRVTEILTPDATNGSHGRG